MIRLTALVVALALAASPALAQSFKTGDITIDGAWSRATPKGAAVGAGYLTVRNDGATPDRLVGGEASFGAVEIHEMTTEDGVMRMRKLKDGLAIPAHGAVRLSPGGVHIMFTHLTRPLEKGSTVTATLTFERGGSVAVVFPVEDIGAAGPAAGDMKGMKM